MRSAALFAAAMAGSAFASPLVKRVYVTDWDYTTDVEYVTDVVGETSTAIAQPPAATSAQQEVVYTTEVQAAAQTVYESYAASSTYVAPSSTYVEPSSTYVAPSSTYVYVAPSSTYVAPSSTEEASTVYVSAAAVSSEAVAAYSAVAVSSEAVTTSSSSGFAFASQCSTPTGSMYPTAATMTTSPTGEAQRKWLAYHNVHRANHTDTCSLYWDYDLENSAQEWANQCSYWHNTTTGSTYSSSASSTWYGQNGGMYSEAMSDTEAAVVFSNMYYQEGANYTDAYGSDQPTEGSNIPSGADIGHFTQMIWQGSYAVGCASQDCSSTFGADVPFVTWCNYRLTGNVDGEYADNIGDVISSPLAPVCTDVETDGCIPESDFV